VTCEACGRDGRYSLRSLLDRRGRDGEIVDWLDEIAADCLKRRGARRKATLS